MATAINPVTGDLIASKGATDSYRDGWDRIFGQRKKAFDQLSAIPADENVDTSDISDALKTDMFADKYKE